VSHGEHISSQFDSDLEGIRSKVLQMGGLVESQIRLAVEALVSNNPALAEEVITREQTINSLELASDEACTHIIALRCPTAGDLRMIMTVMRTIHDLERVGDEAVKIARYAMRLQHEDMVTPRYADIQHITDLVLRMLRQSLDAFARVDPSSAGQVVREDLDVDEEYHRLTRQLVSFMMEDPRTISPSIDLLFMIKSIERIGDHAKNIAEFIIYIVKGTDVRHASREALERGGLLVVRHRERCVRDLS